MHEIVRKELLLRENPKNITVRGELLQSYFLRRLSILEKIILLFRAGIYIPKSMRMHEVHVLWVIENAPACELAGEYFMQIIYEFNPKGYEKAKNLWLDKLSEDNVALETIKNAAKFLFRKDHEIVESIIFSVWRSDNKNSEWLQLLKDLRSSTFSELHQQEKLIERWKERVNQALLDGNADLANRALNKMESIQLVVEEKKDFDS